MIATLTGVISEKIGNQAVLDVHGAGYGVLVTLNDLGPGGNRRWRRQKAAIGKRRWQARC
jgi:hypothetical protein